MSVRVQTVGPEHLAICHAIRHQVFVVGQGVPLDLEVDGLDGQAIHALATLDGRPVGTARLRLAGPDAKAERVAVLAPARGAGIGVALMAHLHGIARASGCARVVLNAQVQVVPFYERLGYAPFGPVFVDAGIDHRAMALAL
jgi:predicted GNAT family N-acyltransferase